MVVVALLGDLGKPRPAVIIQSELYLNTIGITLVPITTNVVDSNLLRVSLEPSAANGLRETSQTMTDKITTVSREKVRQVVGRLEPSSMEALDTQLALFIGLA